MDRIARNLIYGYVKPEPMRRPLVTILLTGLIALMPLPGAMGQSATSDAGAIYLTDELVSDPLGGAGTRVLKAVAEAPADDASEKAYVAFSFFQLTYTTQFEYEVQQDTVLTGPIHAKIYVSCDLPAAFRPGVEGEQSSSAFNLLVDGTEIAGDARVDDAMTCTGPSDVIELDYEVDAAGTELEAGDLLQADFLIWVTSGPAFAVDHVHILVGSTTHPSGLTGAGLPGGDALPETIQDELTGTTGQVNHAFDDATSETYIYNWTTNLAETRIVGNASATNGTAQVIVRDGVGAELVNATVTTEGWNETLDVEGEPGNWTIHIAYADYAGRLEVTIGPVPDAPPATDDGAMDRGNETIGNETDAAGAESADGASLPGPGLLAVLLVALGAAVAVRRRR